MRVAVQKSELPRSRRMAVALGLGLVVTMSATIAIYTWVDDYCVGRISDMGGVVVPGSGVSENFGRIWSEAWPRQRAATAAAGIPELRIHIKRKRVGQLAKKRDEALEIGYLIQETGDFVDVEIAVRNGEDRHRVKAKLRLKGDFPDHLKGEKWSFRVRTSGDDEILGMRVFSIQHPRVRGYAHESLFMEHMRREGVLAPRYEYVHVFVNGRDKGIMALEEHFAKELLESQRRRESVIVRFDETLKWRTAFLMGQDVDFSAPYPLVTPFQSGKIKSSRPNLVRDLDAAVGLMRGFLNKDLPPSQVFDPEITARFLAVAEIWGAEHALAWNNMRFYYNPITGLLEPIAFDANLQDAAFQYLPTLLVSVYRLADPITADWLEDPRIRAPFLRELKRISAEYILPASWDRIAAREKELHSILHAEFPLIPDIGFHFYAWRAQRLQRVDEDNFRTLPLMPPAYPALMHAFLQPSDIGFHLDLYNLVPYPVVVSELALSPETVTSTTKLPIVLPATRERVAPKPTRIAILSPTAFFKVKVDVTATIQGYANTKTVHQAKHYSPTLIAPVLPETTWEGVLAQQRQLRRDGEMARLGPGIVRIRKPLVLPRGVDLTVAPGTQLMFGTDGLLVVRGALQMPGTEQSPIELRPSQVDWCGVAVIGAKRESSWSHVHVSKTRGMQIGKWVPSGAVMFYESPVTMTHCTFTENAAEDALNLFRTKFVLKDVTVERCDSDAIDTDFCTGTIHGGSIIDVGGDGIDISGTTVEVHNVRFENIKDKALSAGEASTMKVSHVQIVSCGTGLASKDASLATIDNSSFTDVKFVAVIAFMKKPEYGPGKVIGSKLKHDGSGSGFRAQLGSSVEVDGKAVTPEDIDVDLLYTLGPMNKGATKSGTGGK